MSSNTVIERKISALEVSKESPPAAAIMTRCRCRVTYKVMGGLTFYNKLTISFYNTTRKDPAARVQGNRAGEARKSAAVPRTRVRNGLKSLCSVGRKPMGRRARERLSKRLVSFRSV